ncbi:MAG: T9SS type A sorting domain-containing protein [Chitinophagaceae bacterium]|nr:T9SS type A sorting domain-containing protein [Chitinophagaceae bacterium]MCW5926257.1 T9SS type A sorting domain-containing protein [Chitinophagaceae bacterium]
MKTKPYPVAVKLVIAVLIFLTAIAEVNAQATYAVPVSIGNSPCSSSTTSSRGFMQFKYTSNNLTLSPVPPTSCNLSGLASPGFSEYNSGISFNPGDQHLYFTRYNAPHSYVWRWMPGSACPPATAILTVYNNTYVIGLTFDANGMGYQLIYTGSYPYGLALQTVNFATNTFGPIIPVSLPSGINPLQGNGDFVIMPNGQFMAILDNNYITINYKDYGIAPLQATLISIIPGNTIIGLSYSDGKLVASDYYVSTSNAPYSGSAGRYRSRYYEISIVDGVRTPITTYPCYFSTDMTDINTAIGAAKKVSSVTPTGTPGVYDICYDIYVQNYGNWPLRNISVTENLTDVFGTGNFSNVSVSLIDNPAGVVLNPSFTGGSGPATRRELLNSSLSNLPASPAANNHFTIRLCLRASNIVIGQVYNNSVTASGIGYLDNKVTDVSTDGDNPDLNSNAKPDDPGEDQPTPFVILTTAEMPPCDALNRILYMQNFGSGSGNGLTTAIPLATGSAGTAFTGYTGSTSQPLAVERYAITRNAQNGNTSRWINRTDHTGNTNGRMMVVNADVHHNVIYRDRVNVPCGNLKYSLFAFVSNIANSSYETFCQDAFGQMVYPKLVFTIRNPLNGHIITNLTTPDITDANWTQYGMKFVMPANLLQVDIEISNAAPGGCGNDLAIDDIQFGLCDPTPTVVANPTAGCTGGITTFNASLSDPTVISGALDYKWQYSNNNVSWNDLSGGNNATYTINPLQSSDVGRYYRVIVAAAGDINNTNCRYISNSFLLTAKDTSVTPTHITADPAFTTCPENPVTLTVQGGSLGTNAAWRWYTGSCGGTLVGTGASIIVNPAVTTTYYVRAEGDCNITQCVEATITVVPCEILPIKFLQFNAVQKAKAVDLNWKIMTSEQISHFEIERSFNGSSFQKIGEVNQQVAANSTAGFSYQDTDIDGSHNTIYYRIKAVGKLGTNKYTNILVVRLNRIGGEKMRISPNPTSSVVQISFFSASRTVADYRLMDMTGKIVLKKSFNTESGQNIIYINDLGRFSEGVYTLMLRNGDKWEYERIVIKR